MKVKYFFFLVVLATLTLIKVNAQTPIQITAVSSLEINNLYAGATKSLTPFTIDHHPPDTAGTFKLTGAPNANIIVSFSLPTSLNTKVTVSYNPTSSAFIDTSKSIVYHDPRVPFRVLLPPEGYAYVYLGGIFSVSPLSSDGTYAGTAILTAGYEGDSVTTNEAIDVRANVLQVTSVGESRTPFLPRTFELQQNYPNPFNPSTIIRYGLSTRGYVSLKVYNFFGQLVRTLVDENQDAGYKSVKFDANNLPSGVYYYRLTTSSFADTKKLSLVK